MTQPILFADGIVDASVTHGVARLTLAQTGPDGKPLPCGQLILPLAQLPSFVQSLSNLVRQVETRLREQQAQQQSASTPEAVPGAFRFGG